jgi:hypothetical protein
MPDFGLSLGKKANSMSMQTGSMKTNTVINGSSNLFLPPEIIGPACSLVPEFKQEAFQTPKNLKPSGYLSMSD